VLLLAQFTANEQTGRTKERGDYIFKRRALPWWAVGTSLIAANISAEQIIGMSGSAYAFGLAIASYEWMGAATLLLAGKYLLPVFLKNQIYTMPEFLKRRYGRNIQIVMAILWIGVYVFVALTAILWLGATAVHAVTGLTLQMSVILLGLFAGNYALYVGLKSAAFADVVQVCMLVLGGLVIVFVALERISGGAGVSGLIEGFRIMVARAPEHFHMILKPDNPFYKYVPGISVLVGGMWIINLAYWGFNQHIIQRALTAKSIREVQNGVVLAAFLKLLVPVLVVLPGVAAVLLVPHLSRPDEAYPTLMTLMPSGLLGLVFVALVAAIIASMRSTLSSIATIFTVDVFKVVHRESSERQLVIVGYIAAIIALCIAMFAATPLLGHFDQAFQYIQEYNGFFTPGIVVVFLLGIFWKRATEAGALAAAIGSPVVSVIYSTCFPAIPFMNRMAYVFLIGLGLAIVVSHLQKHRLQSSTIDVANVDYSTSKTFNIAAFAVIAILVALYAAWW
jgi:SSS family solute:Na+ symporter